MKYCYVFLCSLWSIGLFAQPGTSVTIQQTGNCFQSDQTLPYIQDIDGKPGYQLGSGSYAGISTPILVRWSNSFNFWLIEFGGQPFYINSNPSNIPPATGWQVADPASFPFGSCTASEIPTLTGDVLPVELSRFEATVDDRGVRLAWQTIVEENNEVFEVQRSHDGMQFSTIGTVEGKGFSTTAIDYYLVDENPYSGVNYYRLRQVDFDGAASLSKVISVEWQSSARSSYTFYPNPTHDGLVYLKTATLTERTVNVSVFDSAGRTIHQVSLLSDELHTALDLSSLTPGVYTIQVSDGTTLHIERMVRQ